MFSEANFHNSDCFLYSKKGNRLQPTSTIYRPCLSTENSPLSKAENSQNQTSNSFQSLNQMSLHDESSDSEELSILFQFPAYFFINSEECSIRNITNFQDEMALNEYTLLNKNRKSSEILEKESEFLEETKRRKYSIDSLHKKLKRLFIDFLQKYYCKLFGTTGPPKISQKAISNVTIEFNKRLLSMKVNDFFKNFCNNNPMEKLMQKGKLEEIKEILVFLNKTIKDFIQFYFITVFPEDLIKLREKETVHYCSKLQQRSKIFVEYYTILKPFQKKIK
jgi:hypothetical protein